MKKITANLIFILLCFSVSIVQAQYKVLLNFNDTNGKNPYGSLLLAGNKLYGMTLAGGSSIGNVFSIDTNGGYSDLYNFINPNGMNPYSSLIRIGAKLYGTTSSGGVNNYGNIFSIDTTPMVTKSHFTVETFHKMLIFLANWTINSPNFVPSSPPSPGMYI